MDNIKIFKIWAPDNIFWTQWAKPVLFASKIPVEFPETISLNIPETSWLSSYQQNTALIIDLPEVTGIEESLALAKTGYRPVPLYNGVYGEKASIMTVDVRLLARALFSGAEILSSVYIRNDAPPVFMLDSRRMNGFRKVPGQYDNRWCVFPQDMPSASVMINQGINRIIVRTEKNPGQKIKEDLSHVLFRYQEAGIKIQHTYGNNEEPKNINISKPSHFKSLFNRFYMNFVLSRNSVGGFGALIPYHGDGHYGYG